MNTLIEPADASNTSSSWWKRNRLWLALLVPLLALALVASTYRLVTLYLPWQWSSPIVAHSSQGTLKQHYLELDGVERDREVTVRVVSLEPRETVNDLVAVPGATLWRIELEFEADPDQFLDSCDIELVDAAGNRYDFRSGVVSAKEYGYSPNRFVLSCVPEDTPGPKVVPFTSEVLEPEVQRPRTWTSEILIAVPDGVTPTEVRVAWAQPVFLVLQAPAS